MIGCQTINRMSAEHSLKTSHVTYTKPIPKHDRSFLTFRILSATSALGDNRLQLTNPWSNVCRIISKTSPFYCELPNSAIGSWCLTEDYFGNWTYDRRSINLWWFTTSTLGFCLQLTNPWSKVNQGPISSQLLIKPEFYSCQATDRRSTEGRCSIFLGLHILASIVEVLTELK